MKNSWILAIIIPAGLLFIYALLRIVSQFYILKLVLYHANTTPPKISNPSNIRITIHKPTS
jgi:hypothetical protein